MSIIKLLKSLLFVASIAVSSLAWAANIDVNAGINDVAIHGYDPVAYFTDGKPTQGSHQYTVVYNSAIYQFSNEKNRDKFNANPEDFAPQFGGFCAMGVALNKKLDIDPNAWTVVDGKLYLNLNKAVKKKWSSDIPSHLVTANRNWSGIQGVSITELNEE